jgi:hypothetical protein
MQQASFEQFLRQPESQALVEHHQRKLAQRLARRQEERRSKEFRAQVHTPLMARSQCFSARLRRPSRARCMIRKRSCSESLIQQLCSPSAQQPHPHNVLLPNIRC